MSMLKSKAEGRWYNWYQQQTKPSTEASSNPELVMRNIDSVGTQGLAVVSGGDSCGPTSCSMLAYYYHGQIKEISEESSRDLSLSLGGGWDGSGNGAGGFNLNDVLTALKVKSNPSTNVGANNVAHAIVTNATKRTPMIVNVGWHWVVALEVVNNSCIFLDPWFGVHSVPIASFPAYPKPGKAIDGWIITTYR